jgi:hypothetical protein
MTNAQAIGRLKEMLDANMDSEEAAVMLTEQALSRTASERSINRHEI